MPPGATTFGGNRFSLLSENLAPLTKKKRRNRDFIIDEFPELNKIETKNPKFVVMSADSTDKPLSKFSCFAIYRSIQLISKDIISISELRDGNLLLLVKCANTANKFLNVKELTGLCKIKCALHEKLNITKGTVYAPYLNNVAEDEIVRELKTQGVVSAYKFTKSIDGKKVPNGVLLLDFNSYSLPSKIDITWHSVKVREYIPTPMRCKNCQLLGHTQKYCKNATSCVVCNLPPHSPKPCTRKFCANCAESHQSDSKECQKFIQQKQILTIKTQKKCSLREAQKIHQQQTPIVINSNAYSAVLNKQPTTTLNNPTTTAPTPIIQQPSIQPTNSAVQIPSSKEPLPSTSTNNNFIENNNEQTASTESSLIYKSIHDDLNLELTDAEIEQVFCSPNNSSANENNNTNTPNNKNPLSMRSESTHTSTSNLNITQTNNSDSMDIESLNPPNTTTEHNNEIITKYLPAHLQSRVNAILAEDLDKPSPPNQSIYLSEDEM